MLTNVPTRYRDPIDIKSF